ncbi:MAG: CRISPR-associated helicase Cas3' [Planctomycetia bacterium]|nr:CRISPR-associated helicase Cas3' [Planctomycetia bacterium]
MRLLQHLKDVHAAAGSVLEATANDQLRALGLDPSHYGARFRRCVQLAAATHDLGKANDHFQGMLRGSRDVRENPQGMRHEWVTVLVLQRLKEWLLPVIDGSEVDFSIVEWAVAGHHPAHDHASPPESVPTGGGSGPEMTLLCGHPDFSAILDWLGDVFGLPSPPQFEDIERDLSGSTGVFESEILPWKRKTNRLWNRLAESPDSKLVAAVKNCVVAADIAGSALPKARPHDRDRWSWIDGVFQDRPQLGDLQAVVDHRLGINKPREFQQRVADSTARVTLVKAGCGGGKTLAAYLWAAKNYPTHRLYFCYPTTGTATEGFRDYLFDEAEQTPRVGADLFHGRADVDFEIVLGAERDIDDEEVRLECLRAWRTPVVACTVDTVLGVMQVNRRGLFSWPALAQSAFVFDEIHAYDDALFGVLLRFLKDVSGVPVLLMTASLPEYREAALRNVLGRLDPIPGESDLEQLPRYHKHQLAGINPAEVVRHTLDMGGKVLWVCNTVGRVMDAAKRMVDHFPLIYHSRFKYEDRVERHRDVIAAFRKEGPAQAICSQVAEMSLDLSADLLVTDLAPVPAIIQRLGRLNRRAKPGDPTKPFVVIEPDGPLPYTQKELDAAREWLKRLDNDGIAQSQLVDRWKQPETPSVRPGGSAWLDGGPVTVPRELRAPSVGISVLMAEDVPRVRACPRGLPRFVLPMPVPPRGWQAWPREHGLPIAPAGAINYDPKVGAEWQKS